MFKLRDKFTLFSNVARQLRYAFLPFSLPLRCTFLPLQYKCMSFRRLLLPNFSHRIRRELNNILKINIFFKVILVPFLRQFLLLTWAPFQQLLRADSPLCFFQDHLWPIANCPECEVCPYQKKDLKAHLWEIVEDQQARKKKLFHK